MNPIVNTQIVDSCPFVKWKMLPHNKTIKILSTIVTAVGIDLLMILKKKCFLNRFSFGSKASINDGIPIVVTLINVNWIGTNGYGRDINKKQIASSVA